MIPSQRGPLLDAAQVGAMISRSPSYVRRLVTDNRLPVAARETPDERHGGRPRMLFDVADVLALLHDTPEVEGPKLLDRALSEA